MENNIKIIERKKGNVIVYGNHQYYKHTVYKNGSSLWNCSLKRKKQCKGTITITKEMIVTKENPHQCPEGMMKNELAIVFEDLKSEARTSDRPITKIFEDGEAAWCDKGNNLVAAFPKFENAKHSLYDARNKFAGVTKTKFKTFDDVQVPVQHSDFVLAEYKDEDKMILVFCEKDIRNEIPRTEEIFGDATIKSCPDPFYEIFTIHADLGSTSITTVTRPIIYALLSDKRKETYTTLFRLIKSQSPEWRPKKYHSDFEIAAINAIQEVYPDIEVKGCYFHWQQAMWRMGKKIFGAKKSKPEARIISLSSVLPLLPGERLLEGWEYIKSENDTNNSKITKFLNYVQRNWLKKDFKILSVFGERHRTNNVTESWHSEIKLNKSNTNLMRLLNVLKKLSKTKYNKTVRTRARSLIENDEFITNVLMGLISGELTVGYALEKLR